VAGGRPQQQRRRATIRRLALVGKGPAAQFSDACRLMDADAELDTTTHLVGHLLREVQSSVMAVLQPMVRPGTWPEKGTDNAEVLRIDAVCDALRVPPEDELRRSWRAFVAGLEGRAHRRGLARPRQVDEEFKLFWDRAEAVLYDVSGRIEATYAEALPWIEGLAQGEPDVIAFAQRMHQSTVALDRFFDLAGVAWLVPLRKKGYFADPPPLTPNEDGGYEFPRWPQARFLARVASEAPREVVEIGLALHTDNPEAHQSLVEAACSIPVADALPLVEVICEWLQTPVQWALPFKARELVVRLVEGGAPGEGLALARALLTNPESESGDDVAGEHLAWMVPRIFPTVGIAGLEMVMELIEVRLGGPGADAHSNLWRPTIATARRAGERDRDQIVDAARDGAEMLAEAGTPVVAIVAALETPDTQIGRRLALDLLGRHPGCEVARERLLDRDALEDRAVRREYLGLAAAVFAGLGSEERERFLGWVEEGPRQKDDPRRARLWRLQILTVLGEELPADWESRRRTLIEEFGEIDPDPPRMTAYYSGDMSPLDTAELRAMEVEALVDYLRAWTPEEGIPAPTRSGLARRLEEAVAADPGTYAAQASAFGEVEPVYADAVLGGLRKAVDEGIAFDWDPVLDLAERTAGSSSGEAQIGWGVADLIFHALARGESQIPFGSREQAWRILSTCFGDEDEGGEAEDRDPASLAINSVRCRALQGICRLAVRDKDEGSQELRPELAALLERALAEPIGSSVAVRWTLGACFPWLLYADETRAREWCGRLFPPRGEARLWRAAWEGYIHSAAPAAQHLELLDLQYRRAIEELTDDPPENRLDDPDGALVANLISHYLIGTIEFDEPDGLLDRLYSRASPSRRALAIEAIGNGLDSPASPPAEAVARMEALADRRLQAVKDGAPPEELSGLAWWLESGEFELEWSLTFLRELLEADGQVQPDHMVAEWLSRLSGVHPLATVEILRLMVEGAVRDWFVIGARESIETILRSGLAAGGEAGAVARDVVNIIVAQGANDFILLLDGKSREDESPQP
jgi:hypothetical protein